LNFFFTRYRSVKTYKYKTTANTQDVCGAEKEKKKNLILLARNIIFDMFCALFSNDFIY